jgi:hypothetical protein
MNVTTLPIETESVRSEVPDWWKITLEEFGKSAEPAGVLIGPSVLPRATVLTGSVNNASSRAYFPRIYTAHYFELPSTISSFLPANFLSAWYVAGPSSPVMTTAKQLASETQQVLRSIEGLRTGAGEDEIAATEYAVLEASKSVTGALVTMQLERAVAFATLPGPVLSTDDVGGIRISWSQKNACVRANFGATPHNRTYLYFESGNDRGIAAVDPSTLAERLFWLISKR